MKEKSLENCSYYIAGFTEGRCKRQFIAQAHSEKGAKGDF